MTSLSSNELPLSVKSVIKPVDPEYERRLQNRVRELLGSRFDGFIWITAHAEMKSEFDHLILIRQLFPGAQPVSFEASHFKLLETEDYFVCEKSDGIRYIMIACLSPKGYATFLLDRKNKIQFVEGLQLPLREDPTKCHHETLMDGELVVDLEGDKKSLRFLVFDLMVINGNVVTQRSLSTRLGMFRQDVIEPLETALAKNPELAMKQPFSVELKEMERSYGLPKVFQQIPYLKHANDGLVFTPVKMPYVSGTCHKLLKWKPVDSNTVDFKINVIWNSERKPSYQLFIANNAIHKFYDFLTLEEERSTEWRKDPPNGRIGEFWYDPNWKTTMPEEGYAPWIRAGGWRFVRFRDDKELANDETVLNKIWHSIQDAVTKEMLERHCDIIRKGWKERERFPPPGPRMSISQATTPVTPVTPVHNSRFPVTISPITPLSAHSINIPPTVLSPTVITTPSNGSGYFSQVIQKTTQEESSDLHIRETLTPQVAQQNEFEEETRELSNTRSTSEEKIDSRAKRQRTSRGPSPELTQDRKPLHLLSNSQEIQPSQGLSSPSSSSSTSSRQSSITHNYHDEASIRESPSPKVISLDFKLPEKVPGSQAPRFVEISKSQITQASQASSSPPASSQQTIPPSYPHNAPQLIRRPSPKRRLTEIASILSPVVEEPRSIHRELSNFSEITRWDNSDETTVKSQSNSLQTLNRKTSPENLQSSTPNPATHNHPLSLKTAPYQTDDHIASPSPRPHFVSSKTENDRDEQKIHPPSFYYPSSSAILKPSYPYSNSEALRQESLPSTLNRSIEPSTSQYFNSQSSKLQTHSSPSSRSLHVKYPSRHYTSTSSISQIDMHNPPYSLYGGAQNNFVSSPTQGEFFQMQAINQRTNFYEVEDDAQTHTFINYSNNPLPTNQQSQTRPPLSALHMGSTSTAQTAQYSVSPSASPGTPTPTPTTSNNRPTPQKRKSKAMLEFILNDSSKDADQKRARFGWDE
ncbi:hypothetical protein G9A89_015985 [Geosiphon pyriformis]|nr:hypothetical protein G9A89_015985 [Geosiphon pyriformis]